MTKKIIDVADIPLKVNIKFASRFVINNESNFDFFLVVVNPISNYIFKKINTSREAMQPGQNYTS